MGWLVQIAMGILGGGLVWAVSSPLYGAAFAVGWCAMPVWRGVKALLP